MTRRQAPTESSGVITVAILLAVVSVLYFARAIFIPLAFAITLALILTPAVGLLRKLHLGQATAVVLAMLFTIGAVCGASWVIFNQLVAVANELPRYQENIHHRLALIHAPGVGPVSRATATVRSLGLELSGATVPAISRAPADRPERRGAPETPVRPVAVEVVQEPANQLEYLGNLLQPFVGPLEVLVIVLGFSVFLLVKKDDLRDRLFRLVGMGRLNVMTRALDDATSRVSRYLFMQFLMNASFGALCGIGLYLIGVPYAPLWGIMVGIFRIIPYVGVMVSTLLPLALSLAVFDTWTPSVLVLLLFAGLELVTGNFIEPWLYGVHTGISPLALLLTTALWTALWGYAGLILSTPLTVCVVVLGRYVPQFSFLHIILGDEAVLAAEAQYYQRMLAMDYMEAQNVASHFLDDHSLSELYDLLVIPALTMAEHDRHKGTLDLAREEFLFLSVKEMLAEFSEKTLEPDPVATRAPFSSPSRIFVLPASDEADETTAAMLAQLLEQAGYAAIALSLGPTLHQTIELMSPGPDDMFCVAALPPFAFARTIAMTRQLKLRYPLTKTIAGVWGFTGNTERALQRFRPGRPDQLVTTLAGAVAYIAAGNQISILSEPG